MAEYTVIVGCSSDKKKTRFEPGDIVTDKDFPKAVIGAWVEQGVLLPMKDNPKVVEPKEVYDGGNS